MRSIVRIVGQLSGADKLVHALGRESELAVGDRAVACQQILEIRQIRIDLLGAILPERLRYCGLLIDVLHDRFSVKSCACGYFAG